MVAGTLYEKFANRYFAVKWKTVVVWYLPPGLSSVEGKFGLLGESGKCCVSMQSAPCGP